MIYRDKYDRNVYYAGINYCSRVEGRISLEKPYYRSRRDDTWKYYKGNMYYFIYRGVEIASGDKRYSSIDPHNAYMRYRDSISGSQKVEYPHDL